MLNKYYFAFLISALFPFVALAGAADSLRLKFDGTLKTKLEWNINNNGDLRFNLRNSRVGFRGELGQYVMFRVQVELNSEGDFRVLDGFGTIKPSSNFSVNFGQTAVPFENQYLITPSEMMFANRAFIGKFFTPGSRDIGIVAMYQTGGVFPLTVEGGFFNGNAINNPVWTDNPSYAFRLTGGSLKNFKTSAKVYRYPAREWLLYGADISYCRGDWLLQAEVMNRYNYNDAVIATSKNYTGAYIQSSYTISRDFWKIFHGLIPALRWDAMNHTFSNGIDVNRITAGLGFALSKKPFSSLIRIDYEHYFLHNDLPELTSLDEHVKGNKLTLELLLKF